MDNVKIQGNEELSPGKDSVFFCDLETTQRDSDLEFEWIFKRPSSKDLEKWIVKKSHSHSYLIQNATKRNLGQLQCSGKLIKLYLLIYNNIYLIYYDIFQVTLKYIIYSL